MRIRIITPAPPRTRHGNRVTALRWQRILRDLGHRVSLHEDYAGERCDLLIALHARKSFASICRYRETRPDAPLIVALTGTDVYGDLARASEPLRAIQLADKVIVLQPLAARELPADIRTKAVTIYQSCPVIERIPPDPRYFDICVIAHLRDVKDPFRAAEAARNLPPSSRIRILHAGGALDAGTMEFAQEEMRRNPRYRWLGEMPGWKARRLIARSRCLALTSKMEGGANVISEALAASTPILSSRIPGSIGLLGEDYPGYFEVGDTAGLTKLMQRAESDPQFYAALKERCVRLKSLVDPTLELESWRALLRELAERQ